MIDRQKYRFLLNVCKDFIKVNFYTKEFNLSQSALSRFINDPDYNIIGDDTIKTLADEIYGSCLLYCDLYRENVLDEKNV